MPVAAPGSRRREQGYGGGSSEKAAIIMRRNNQMAHVSRKQALIVTAPATKKIGSRVKKLAYSSSDGYNCATRQGDKFFLSATCKLRVGNGGRFCFETDLHAVDLRELERASITVDGVRVQVTWITWCVASQTAAEEIRHTAWSRCRPEAGSRRACSAYRSPRSAEAARSRR